MRNLAVILGQRQQLVGGRHAIGVEQFRLSVAAFRVLQGDDEDGPERQAAGGGKDAEGLAGKAHHARRIRAQAQLRGDLRLRARTRPGLLLLAAVLRIAHDSPRPSWRGERLTSSVRTMRTTC